MRAIHFFAIVTLTATVHLLVLSPRGQASEGSSPPQQYLYQVRACEETNAEIGAWVCRSYGRDVVYSNLEACQEARESDSAAYQKEGFWFQCWRTPTWTQAEGRPE